MSSGTLVVLCGAAIVVAAMAAIVADYLFSTYSHASMIVAGLATLIVLASVIIPYGAAQRMRMRKAQRLAAPRQD
jgi:predicted Na+-dependent transporter